VSVSVKQPAQKTAHDLMLSTTKPHTPIIRTINRSERAHRCLVNT
jgi:hypothetical protein